MKKVLMGVAALLGAASMASASMTFSYTATAAPGSNPDGVDQNNNPVSVWTVTLTPPAGGGGGGEGVYEGTAFTGEQLSGWQEYSYPGSGGPGTSGSVDSVTTFPGGALAIGQTVSINFEMRASDPEGTVGLSLLSGTAGTGTPAITFGIYGGEPNSSNSAYTGTGYYYSDASTGGVDTAAPGTLGYQYQDEFSIAFTVTGPGTYSAVAGNSSGTDSWTGTFSGALLGMDVFNHDAGNVSDTCFNNLTVANVPEPAGAVGIILALVMAGRRRQSA